MDLRSSNLYWPTTCRRPRLGGVRARKRKVDTLVIGAGITGALVAYELTKAGTSVAIIDERSPASGSTPASTALLQYEIDTPLVKLGGLVGKRNADAAYVAAHRALADMVTLHRELGADTELKARRSLHLAVKPTDVRAFRKEVEARERIGIAARMLSRRSLRSEFGLNRPGAILSEAAFEVNPLKLTYQLLRAAKRRGAIVLSRTSLELSPLAEQARPFQISLPSGGAISAEHIVIATGYETPEQFLEIAKRTELRSTFAFATAPLRSSPWPERALLWDAGDPYFYARTTADGRILAGGEDEPFTTAKARDALLARKSQKLAAKLKRLLPDRQFRIEFRWAGTFAQTKDGLPYIGEHRKWPGVHFALGYGGNGITFSLIAAQIIAASIAGNAHPSAKLFDFER